MKMHALLKVEDCIISAVIALCKVITTGALNFKMAALHFFNTPQDVIIVTEENTSL